jgi:serine protease Do
MKRDSGRVSVYILLVLVGLVLGGVAGHEIYRRISRGDAAGGQAEATAGGDSATAAGASAAADRALAAGEDIDISRTNAIVGATRAVSKSVVGIVVTQLQYVGALYYYSPRDFFNPFLPHKRVPQYKEVENMGSGFLIDEHGLVLTNNHVVEGAQKLHVNFPDGNQYEARIVGQDHATDIAVLKVETNDKRFTPVRLGNSNTLMIGEWAIAIGNPFLNFFNDPRPTVTVGVVSALDRNFAPAEGVTYQDMIQTDAAINPGNSGGPLLNARGEVIGINTFIYTGSANNRGSIGIGFAIPINRAKKVVDELVTYGRRRQVWTGITVQNLDRSVALAFGYEQTRGVLITDIQNGSPGDKAGLREGDIIVRIGGRSIMSHQDLEGVFLSYFVGDRASMTVIRDNKEKTVEVLLEQFPRSRR